MGTLTHGLGWFLEEHLRAGEVGSIRATSGIHISALAEVNRNICVCGYTFLEAKGTTTTTTIKALAGLEDVRRTFRELWCGSNSH
jgi:hypothetical protein